MISQTAPLADNSKGFHFANSPTNTQNGYHIYHPSPSRKRGPPQDEADTYSYRIGSRTKRVVPLSLIQKSLDNLHLHHPDQHEASLNHSSLDNMESKDYSFDESESPPPPTKSKSDKMLEFFVNSHRENVHGSENGISLFDNSHFVCHAPLRPNISSAYSHTKLAEPQRR